MPYVERSSNLKEQYAQRAMLSGIPALLFFGIGGVMLSYQMQQGGPFVALSIVLLVMGLALLVYAIVQLSALRKVPSFPVACPFCQHKNEFMSPALSDVRCEGCQRQIPIDGGRILQVFQVRCGYCNYLNYYSEKSTGLLCEECNREVPISTADGEHRSKSFETYARHDDDRPYDLVLHPVEHYSEDLVGTLQQMLALNRNQVKELIEQAPVTLLTGIPKKKAELLKSQIDMHHGRADFKVTE